MEENQTSNFNFQDTLATQKIFALKKRIRAVCGGTSASKTISILIWLIDYAQSNKGKKIDVMSESYPHLEDGAIKDFKALMLDREYWRDEFWNETKHVYTFETGSVLKFISIDKLGKAHGPRRDVLFINEANNIPFNIYDQLEVRTKEYIFLDWNPTTEFWYYTEIKNKLDHDFITLTYKDCLNVLDQRVIDSIESKRERKNWWKVYGLGEIGEIEGRIYTDWRIILSVPHEARLERYGLDFGYTNNPSAIVAVYYYNGGWIFDEIVYKTRMSNKELADTFKTHKPALVIADSAEPKSIDELRINDINVQPCIKGKDSVKFGIQKIQNQPISVTERSINIIKEYRNYMFDEDKNGKILDVPIKENDHTMDAIRYALSTLQELEQPKSYWDELWAEELKTPGERDKPNLGR